MTKSNTVCEVHAAHDEDNKCIPNFGWKISVGQPGMSIWLKDNIKMDVGETGNEGMNWTEQVQDMVGFYEETDEPLDWEHKIISGATTLERDSEMCS